MEHYLKEHLEIVNLFLYKGYQCYIVRNNLQEHYTAYVVVGRFPEVLLQGDLYVHGGVTFQGPLEHIGRPKEYAIGIDFANAGKHNQKWKYGKHWELVEVKDETLKLVDEFIYWQELFGNIIR